MKNIDDVIKNYLEVGYNSINPNEHDGLCKPTFTDIKSLYDTIQSYENLFLKNSTINSKISLNHIISSYYFTNKMISEDNIEMTEIAMLFLQTYLRSLQDTNKDNFRLTHDKLYKYFNINQEILNLPYAWALYLGGVYYFNENKSQYKIGDNDVYKITNNLTASSSEYDEIGNDIYQSKLLLKYPTNFYETLSGTQKLNINQVRILNRSIFDDYEFNFVSRDTTLTNLPTFKYNNNNERIPEIRHFYYHKTMPPFGYGIQNQFLNAFNNYMFNDHLNGRNDKLDDLIDGNRNNMGVSQPYAIIGSDLGIIKPIKTYNSDIEFTAFYRTPVIGSISITKEQIITNFQNQIALISQTNDREKVKNEIIKLFITFSKIKNLYLKELISDSDLLDLFKTLAESKKLGIKYIYEVFSGSSSSDVIGTEVIEISDIYHIIFNVFFSSYKYFGDKTKLTLEARKTKQDLYDKVKKSKNVVEQVKNNLPPYLFNLTGLNNVRILTQTKQIETLVQFLTKIWDTEKSYLKKDYEYYNEGSTMIALYPSAGGVFFPDLSFQNLVSKDNTNEYPNISIKRNNNPSITRTDINQKYGDFRQEVEYQKKIFSSYSSDEIPRLYKTRNSIVFPTDDMVNEIIPNSIASISHYGDPMYPDFFIPRDATTNKTKVDIVGYENLIYNNFDNDALLKNTTRFLWFDTANFGLDLQIGDKLNLFDFDNENRFPMVDNFDNIEYQCYKNTYFNHLDYGTNNYPFDKIRESKNIEVNEYYNYNKKIDSKFRDQFNLRTIIDSVDLDKFEFFKNLFLEFSSNDKTLAFNSYNNKFTLKSLIKGSMLIFSKELTPLTVNGVNYNVDDLTSLIIGNSMYNYDFASIFEISKIINSALTLAQYNRVGNVIKEFNKTPIQVPNLTQYGQVENSEGEYYVQPHNLITLPEIMFSGVKNYDELLTKYKEKDASLTDEEIGVYFFRKTYFGNKYVNPYNPNDDLNELIVDFISKYLYENNIIIEASLGPNDIAFDQILLIVKQFFKDINVEITESNLRYLLKPLRTYIKNVLIDNKLYDEIYSYGKKLLTREEIDKKESVKKPSRMKEIERKVNNDNIFNNWLKAHNDFSNF